MNTTNKTNKFERFINVIIGDNNYKFKKIIISLIYILMAIFFIFKVNFYENNVGRFPDETAHISYIAHLEMYDEIIPDFREMRILDGVRLNSDTTRGSFDESTINYLGHPPLYYNIMRMTGAIDVEGKEVMINMNLLRNVTQLMSYLALALAFYIGFTRIKRLILHVVYSSIIVCVPMVAYISAGVSNDTLCFLAISIVALGLIRMMEEKRDYLTYFLIGFGVFVGLLTKLTVGLIILVGGVFFLLYLIIKDKSLKVIFCKEFLTTLPFYIIVLLYYLFNIKKYGGVNPSLGLIAPEYYKTTYFYVPVEHRRVLTFPQYIEYYCKRFIRSWTGIHSHVSLEKEKFIFSKDTFAIASVLLMPFITMLIPTKNKINKAMKFLYLGVVLAALYQFYNAYNGFANISGYLGGFQSRYYICAVGVMAMLLCIFVDDILNLVNGKLGNKGILIIINCIIAIICLYFVVLLFQEDFIYFINNFVDYL